MEQQIMEGSIRRRQVLGRLVGAATGGILPAGCMNAESPGTSEATVLAPPDTSPEPAPGHGLEIAGWPVADGVLLDALQTAMSAIDTVPNVTKSAPDDGRRGTFESRVGDRLARFDPPSTFLTVAGDELARYRRAVHLHSIPDLFPADDGADWVGPAMDAVRAAGTPWAVPVAIWGVNRWCVRPGVLSTAGVALEGIEDLHALADAVDRIEMATEMTGLAIARTGTARLALFCDCVVDVGGRSALRALSRGELHVATLEDAAEPMGRLLSEGSRSVDPGSAADRFATNAAAITRATPRRLARLAGSEPEEMAVVAIPARQGLCRLDVLALPYPKRNPSPVATERGLVGLQNTPAAQQIASVPGLLSADRRGWDALDDDESIGHRTVFEEADTLALAPSTGCMIDPTARWQAIEGLSALAPSPTPEDLRAAVSPLLAVD